MRDTFCSYYTDSKDITSYMIAKLGIVNNDVILEPSAGEGIFVDEILKTNNPVHIDALEMNREAISILKKKYKNIDSVVVRETDTLLDEQLDLYSVSQLWLKQTDTLFDKQLDAFSALGGHYSKVIGNPPYGAWQDYKKREALKKKFAGHYVKETYSLFLLRCISVLRIQGKLSFIIPDTYLFLNMHSRLRTLILTNTKIDEILIFPSKFFPGVSFGYSNLSIITLERCNKSEALNNTFKVIQGFRTTSEFALLLGKAPVYPERLQVFTFMQKDILSNEQCRVILADSRTSTLLTNSPKKLGDVADVVTGFYTGDNLRFIKAVDKGVKGAKNYEVVEQDQVFSCTSLYGITDVKEGYVRYIKSASKRRYVRQKDEWFVRWDQDTIDFYNNNKKSRFQNSSFYFKTGIGIPMVKSSSIRAFLMQDRVFDQSIVGIFPKDNSKLYYLLALMNSDAINNLIHTINPTANNSANYIRQLPYIEPTQEVLSEIISKVRELISLEESMEYDAADCLHKEINFIIGEIYEK
ncbi:restriction endonuclease [Clostridium sp. chh4-2]|uniref:Eco57I restriction-modification methylase domain-containing protein n=1 Tax=Clostridium sp. chh4-2 TaxID=2067550 RepID=UPI000CCDAFA5|nr:N-6 DNA methylase [Clostridium sp. chh4-2]PNV63551.1 restriction endonuclease [Clostridium sp. chh4-2]